MLNIIIVDNNKIILKDVAKMIDNILFSSYSEYKKYLYSEYDEDFYNKTNEPLINKIYILDLVTPLGDGLDVATEIYEKDAKSKIIFLSSHEDEYYAKMLRCADVFCGFISKEEDIEKNLKKYIEKAINSFSNEKVLTFKKGKTLYRIPINDITHIEVNKNTITIHSNNRNSIEINKSLKEIEEKLPSHFIKSHKSCIVNTKNILKYNSKERYITFTDYNNTTLISRKYKKDLETYLIKYQST